MIKNYLLVSLRNLFRQKFFFILNVFGLSLGIAACLLCYLHINYELSYDQWHSRADRIYRVVTGDVPGGDGWVKVSAPIPPKIQEEVPEVQQFVRLTKATYEPKITVKHNESIYNEEDFYMADAAIFEVFDLQIVNGDPKNPLSDLNSVVISESTAQKYFGQENPLGQSLRVSNQLDFVVTGVYKNIPFNSHMRFDFLISFDNLERVLRGTKLNGNWGQFNYFAYVLLHPDAQKKTAENNIHNINVSLGDNQNVELYDIHLQPLTDIHFQANSGNILPAYSTQYLFIYSAIALGILIISFINFVNLSTAGSTRRIKEVGVRKVVGASRAQLIYQFISESFVVTLAAMGVALLWVEAFMIPYLNDLLGTQMATDYTQPGLYMAFFTTLIIIGISSGAYIAFFIASFSPAVALRGAIKIGSRGGTFKNLLLGIQFCISLILVLSSMFIYQQLNHLQGKDIGLNKSQVLNIALYDKESANAADVLKQQLESLPSIESVSATRYVAGQPNWNQTVWWDGQDEAASMLLIMADEQFLKTMEIELIEGDASLVESRLSKDEIRYVINETARNLIGWDTALGKSFSAYSNSAKRPITGVVKDFNYRSLHHSIQPCVIVMRESVTPSQLMLRAKASDMRSVLAEVEQTFRATAPNSPFEFGFLDQQFAQLYEAENRTGKVVGFLTIVALVLSTLGLYGLISFMVQERTREMAIRKVLGITLPNILVLLSRGYVKLFLFANLIGIPVLWYAMEQWLSNFSYRIDLSLVSFTAASLLILTVILLTVGIKALSVSRTNPIVGLRYE